MKITIIHSGVGVLVGVIVGILVGVLVDVLIAEGVIVRVYVGEGVLVDKSKKDGTLGTIGTRFTKLNNIISFTITVDASYRI